MSPAPAPESDIGMGIPMEQTAPVYAQDLPASLQAFTPAPSRDIPQAMAPSSRRFSSTRPEFIYTNPAAAQQAAANYQARLGFEAQQDRGYQDYLSRLANERGANERANVQAQIYGTQLQAQGQEGAANRASAERITMMSEAVRQHRQNEQAWLDNERAVEMGEGVAETLNRDPAARVDRRYVKMNPTTGRWESIFRRQPRPVPPNFNQPAVPQAPSQMVTPSWPGAAAPVPINPAAPVAATGPVPATPTSPVVVPSPGPAAMIEPAAAYEPSGIYAETMRSPQAVFTSTFPPATPAMSPALRRQIEALGIPQ